MTPDLNEVVEDNNAYVARYLTDTWFSILAMIDPATGLVQDRLNISSKRLDPVTSPTNIGLFLASLVAARDLKLIEAPILHDRITNVLQILSKMERVRGLYFFWYRTSDGSLDNSRPQFISTVDNAWLISGLLIVKNALPEFQSMIQAILSQMDFLHLYDSRKNLFYGGYSKDSETFSHWHYSLLNTEARIASYVALNNFELSKDHLYGLSAPNPILKSWGGSMFEALMPSLFVNECDDTNWNKIHLYHLEKQMLSARNENFWGFSPCDSPEGIYTEYGVGELALKEGGYGVNDVITPHAIFLAMDCDSKKALDTLSRLEKFYPAVYTEGYGFADSIDVKTGSISGSRLILDQAMSFLALFNYQTKDRLHSYFNNVSPLSISQIY